MQNMWSEKLSYKQKLRTYVHMKNTIETAPFLKRNISNFQRSLLRQVTIGILPLSVETGRYYRIPLENRQIRKENFIEDEIHFVCKCSAYNLVRKNCFPNFNAYFNLNKSTRRAQTSAKGAQFLHYHQNPP